MKEDTFVKIVLITITISSTLFLVFLLGGFDSQEKRDIRYSEEELICERIGGHFINSNGIDPVDCCTNVGLDNDTTYVITCYDYRQINGKLYLEREK